MNVSIEWISNFVNYSNWSDMMIYTRWYKVKWVNINKLNNSVKYYTTQPAAAWASIWTYWTVTYADSIIVVSWWSEIVSSYANNVNPWLVSMWINHSWNDSKEATHLHFWTTYISQWFWTHRNIDYKIDNWYWDDLAWVTNLWDSASINKQNWFIR